MQKLRDTKLAIAHDYLVQYGGAERVVQSWVEKWPKSIVSTLAYIPEKTYDTFRGVDVNARITNRAAASRVDALLPILPRLSKGLKVAADADIALVSTSGFAHLFQFHGPRVLYFHSPARWLYESSQYRQGLPLHKKIALSAVTPYLLRHDQIGSAKSTRIIANSKVTQERIWRAYRVDSEIINPPVRAIAADYGELPETIPEGFLLCVARARGYKNVELAARAAALAEIPLVVAGSGSQSLGAGGSIQGVGWVSDGQLRSLYRAASAVILTGDEDFGLTGPEANLEGTPVVAIPKGGYLETVTADKNGYLSSDSTPESLAEAIGFALDRKWPNTRSFAEGRFSVDTHIARIEQQLASLIE